MTLATVTLPDDVWRCIAALLSPQDLLPLASLNRAFLSVALDERYRVVRLENRDDWTLERLQWLRTPRIAGRVRQLDVGASFLESLAQDPDNTLGGAKTSRWQWLLPAFLCSRVLPTPKASHTLAGMTQAVDLMTNVEQCSFELSALSLTPETTRFLSAAHTSFGSRFRKISLSARLRDFPAMLAGIELVTDLEQLEITFEYDFTDDPSPSGASANTIRTTILPFIARFSHSLRALSISAISKVDISPIFEDLPPFAHLEKLAVQLTCGYLDAAALMTILDAHTASLSRVEVCASCQTTALSIWRALAQRQPLVDKLDSLILGYESHVFEIARGDADLESDSSSTLDALFRRPFTESDNLWEPQLETVLKTLSALPRTTARTKLRIGVFTLTPRVFSLLVRYLPDLHTLNVVVYSPSYRMDWIMGPQLEQVARDWHLEELAIWDYDSGRPSAALPPQMERLVGEVVKRLPSVRKSNARKPVEASSGWWC
ncbi:F-box domain-containing protein [Mycena indigotica]|uniref:F-box domain-containing protein n=1 Tax=Mycena indigotica TaxID=2126181 RepID=A0A8H6VQW3_9AGAR|nr:F-box domain-containing protein [Mycena indigotica]KAF7290717.1 F-box domain-containing protein [Mycena indigotica]